MIKEIKWEYKFKEKPYSLAPIKSLLSEFENPQKNIPFPIHIVGTNGKGSTVAFLEAILKEAGFKSNVYTSPNLVFLNERIKIENKEITDDELLFYVSQISTDVSFFECLTAIAFNLFAKSQAQFSLIEAGLGGRFDATNVINSKLCILTSVSFDHTSILGNTIKEITGEKLAVDKGSPFIISKQPYQEVYSYAKTVQKPIIYGDDFEVIGKEDGFIYKSQKWNLNLPKPALKGEHQYFNASNAIRAVQSLVYDYGFNINEEAIIKGLQNAKWRARFELLNSGKIAKIFPHLKVYLDGAHNENGVEMALKEVKKMEQPFHLICGFLSRKDVTSITPKLKGFKNVHITEIHSSENSKTKGDLKTEFLEAGVCVSSVHNYFYEALTEIGERANVLIFGSLYLAGEVIEWDLL